MAHFELATCSGAWWVFVGTFAMVAMFLGVSIPMMEQRSLERRPEYARVVERVSVFIPRPPKKRPQEKSRTTTSA